MPTPAHPERVWQPVWHTPQGGNQTQSTATAWFLYVGYVDAPVTLNHVECLVTTTGASNNSAYAAEFALCSSPQAPNGSGQILTVLSAHTTSSFTAGTAPYVVRSASSLALEIPAGTHLWTGLRTSMSTTQCGLAEGTSHNALGDVLALGGTPAALTSFSTISTVLDPQTVLNHGPAFIWATED